MFSMWKQMSVESTNPSATSLAAGKALLDNSVMLVWLDGMDQAKFKCPRRLEMTKQFEKMWRPQLHLVVVTVLSCTEQA